MTKQPDYLNRIDELKDELVKDLSGLIKIKSVKDEPAENAPFGKGVDEAFRYMLDLGKREGFDCVNIENIGGHIDYGKPDSGETMGILCHLDVVPEGSGWDGDPFSGEVADGVLWGRGTLDDKGPAMSAFYAMKALKDCGYEPAKKVRMVLGLDEETGSTGMEIYKKNIKMPDFAIVPDSDFPLVHGEMGIMIFDLVKRFGKPSKGGITLKKISGGTAANMVPDAASAVIVSDNGFDGIKELAAGFSERTGHQINTKGRGKSLELSCTGVSSHGAHPDKGINAVTIMIKFLSELTFNCEEINDFIDFYMNHIADEFNGESLGCGLSDEISGKLILNAGMIDLTGESVKLTLNIRCPISKNDEDVYAAMSPVLEKYDIGIVKNIYEKPVYVPKEDPTVQTLLSIYRRHTGDMESQPLVIGGGTYARDMENAIAFGALYPGDPDTMHQKNECVRIDRLIQTAKIYADAIYELAVKPEIII
jgi:succinyl-diaminopimelate desuccinylase